MTRDLLISCLREIFRHGMSAGHPIRDATARRWAEEEKAEVLAGWDALTADLITAAKYGTHTPACSMSSSAEIECDCWWGRAAARRWEG